MAVGTAASMQQRSAQPHMADWRNPVPALILHRRRTLMIPPIRRSSSSTSDGDTFSRVVATSSTPPSCACAQVELLVASNPSGKPCWRQQASHRRRSCSRAVPPQACRVLGGS